MVEFESIIISKVREFILGTRFVQLLATLEVYVCVIDVWICAILTVFLMLLLTKSTHGSNNINDVGHKLENAYVLLLC
jgi:hypothetical protein